MRTRIANFIDVVGLLCGALGYRLSELANKIDPVHVSVVEILDVSPFLKENWDRIKS